MHLLLLTAVFFTFWVQGCAGKIMPISMALRTIFLNQVLLQLFGGSTKVQ